MFSPLLLLAALATADTAPVRLDGAPAAAAPMTRLTPLARALSRPKSFDVDSMVLDKSDRQLTAYHRGLPVRTYRVALGANPVGPKERRGDRKTPEGLYYIEGRNPESRYHLSLRISYPAPKDVRRAAQRGVPPGGDIMLHGLPPKFADVGASHVTRDWTEGCVALTNDEIEELWRAVPDGARILIVP